MKNYLLLISILLIAGCGSGKQANTTPEDAEESMSAPIEQQDSIKETAPVIAQKSENEPTNNNNDEEIDTTYLSGRKKLALDTTWVKRYCWAYKEDIVGTDFVLQFIHPSGKDRIAQRIREDVTKKFFEFNKILPLDELCMILVKKSFRNVWDGWSGTTYLYRYSAVKFANNKALSYIIYHDQMVGCGDGRQFYSYCYSLSTGRQITIDSLFSQSAQSEIIELLKTRKDDSGKEELMEPIWHLKNFILLPKGLIFIYNPYEIGCGADGEFRYTVKFSEIKHLLKPQAIGYFFK